MIFACTVLPTYGWQVAHTAQLDERCRQEATEADVDDETALDDLDHRTLDHAVGLLDLLDRAPRPLVLRTLLRQDEAPFLVLLGEDERFDLLAERHDLVRVDVVADAQLAGRDHALALVADVEQDLVLVDLHHGAVDELAVLDVDHRAVDGVGERHAEVVSGDLAGGVVALLVEGAHPESAGRRGGSGVGQGTSLSERDDEGYEATNGSDPPRIRTASGRGNPAACYRRRPSTRNSGDSILGGSSRTRRARRC